MEKKKEKAPASSNLAESITRLVDARVEQRIAAMVAEWERLDAQEDAAEEAQQRRMDAEHDPN